jgi:hypothetical protein
VLTRCSWEPVQPSLLPQIRLRLCERGTTGPSDSYSHSLDMLGYLVVPSASHQHLYQLDTINHHFSLRLHRTRRPRRPISTLREMMVKKEVKGMPLDDLTFKCSFFCKSVVHKSLTTIYLYFMIHQGWAALIPSLLCVLALSETCVASGASIYGRLVYPQHSLLHCNLKLLLARTSHSPNHEHVIFFSKGESETSGLVR